jgi:hypothetical protein
MTTQITIPENIKVGFKNRTDTYTGKLGFIIHQEKKKWRQEKSWNNWRDASIEPIEFKNELVEGYVINRNVGGVKSGYDRWSTRQEKIRMFDPRGFEFEITPQNLLFILQNSSSIKGKGIEEACIFGWDGKVLVLIPKSAPEYIEIQDYNFLKNSKIAVKDLVIGGIYLNAIKQKVTFLEYSNYYNGSGESYRKCWIFNGKSILPVDVSFLKEYTGEKNDSYAHLYEKLQKTTGYKEYTKFQQYVESYVPASDLKENYSKKQFYLEVVLKNGKSKYKPITISKTTVLKPFPEKITMKQTVDGVYKEWEIYKDGQYTQGYVIKDEVYYSFEELLAKYTLLERVVTDMRIKYYKRIENLCEYEKNKYYHSLRLYENNYEVVRILSKRELITDGDIPEYKTVWNLVYNYTGNNVDTRKFNDIEELFTTYNLVIEQFKNPDEK